MQDFKYDQRGVEDWKEIAEEVFTTLISLEWRYGGGGLVSAEVQHHLPGCMLFLDYSLNSQKQVVCRAHLKTFRDYDTLHWVGTTIIGRPTKRYDYHPKARRVETPLC